MHKNAHHGSSARSHHVRARRSHQDEDTMSDEDDAAILAREQAMDVVPAGDLLAAALAAPSLGSDDDDDDDDDDVVLLSLEAQRRIARRGTMRMLVDMQQSLGDALACMMTVHVDKAPECVGRARRGRGRGRGRGAPEPDSHDAIIDCYDTSIHAFVQVPLSSCACNTGNVPCTPSP